MNKRREAAPVPIQNHRFCLFDRLRICRFAPTLVWRGSKEGFRITGYASAADKTKAV